uniref:Uncharacterized protein n=1 Tax=Ochrobactrum phage ORM_20 TaxID=2985243 RepID=A0A9N6ZGD4_9VIRU|nr:hypothetical protein ORM20_00244 [Ochrobactrum phage ORM_20]
MIVIEISKVSLPDTYTKRFTSVKDAVEFMKERQCRTCLYGEETEDWKTPDLSNCNHLLPFFSTSCGLEFEVNFIDIKEE